MRKLFATLTLLLALTAPSTTLGGMYDGPDHATPAPSGWTWDDR